MSDKTFKIKYLDNGYCRIVYEAVNADNQKIYYCLQDEGDNCGGVVCYRMSGVDGEPDYERKYHRNKFEIPIGDSDIEIIVRKYLTMDSDES